MIVWPCFLQTVVHDLTLAVDKGECFGLLGPNGAGEGDGA